MASLVGGDANNLISDKVHESDGKVTPRLHKPVKVNQASARTGRPRSSLYPPTSGGPSAPGRLVPLHQSNKEHQGPFHRTGARILLAS